MLALIFEVLASFALVYLACMFAMLTCDYIVNEIIKIVEWREKDES